MQRQRKLQRGAEVIQERGEAMLLLTLHLMSFKMQAISTYLPSYYSRGSNNLLLDVTNYNPTLRSKELHVSSFYIANNPPGLCYKTIKGTI